MSRDRNSVLAEQPTVLLLRPSEVSVEQARSIIESRSKAKDIEPKDDFVIRSTRGEFHVTTQHRPIGEEDRKALHALFENWLSDGDDDGD